MENHHRIIIIGSGPAGLTAALYAGRANLHPLVFEGIQPGGQLTITTDVENYPGFPEGILGPEMMDAFRKQARHFNAKTLFQDVTKVDFSVRPFRIHSNGEENRADRKSTRLNSSHGYISYAVFCLKKKKTKNAT